jgi:hypothetical protein
MFSFYNKDVKRKKTLHEKQKISFSESFMVILRVYVFNKKTTPLSQWPERGCFG